VNLHLRPVCTPLVGLGAALGAGTLSWVVVPRLVAHGVVRAGDRVHAVAGAPAYHDHNWGAWRWGDDFAWQWGFVADPAGRDADPRPRWSAVYSRLTDRARARDFDTKLCLWRDDTIVRIFGGDDLALAPEGRLAARSVPRFPPPLRLAVSTDRGDVPARFVADGRSGADRVRLDFRPQAAAAVVVPNETDLGFTLIQEAAGVARLEGAIDGQEVSVDGSGIFEFLTFD
jgi:hypothetical protein